MTNEIKYRGKTINLESVAKLVDETDLKLLLEFYLEQYDKIVTDSPNTQYLLLGKRKAIKELLDLPRIVEENRIKQQNKDK